MNKKNKTFIALSGLPRTGSTLLSSILYQNPDIYTEGHSPVCQLMWDMSESISNEYSQRAFIGNNKIDISKDFVSFIPELYYKNTTRQIIIDKCRSWTFPENVNLIKTYIRKDPKIIVMERDLEEIVDSFLYYAKTQNWNLNEFKQRLFLENSEPFTRPLLGYNYAKNNNNGEYFFVDYNDFILNPQKTVESIYDFCEIKKFNHWYENIKEANVENDYALGHPGLHTVRGKIEKRKYSI